MLWLIVFTFTTYVIAVTRVAVMWRSIKPPESVGYFKGKISIIIAARNEEENIRQVIASILKQESGGNFDIRVVDDHSADNTRAIVEELMSNHPQVRLLQNPGEGKKSAIAYGVKETDSDWVMVTDADCLVPEKWIANYRNYMSEEAHFISAPIVVTRKNLFHRIQNQEQAALTAVGAVSLSLGFPSMVNAANMAFRRQTFLDVGGYSGNIEIPTGDDEFLMKEIHNKYPLGVNFLKDPELIVEAKATKSVIKLINQRRRWASKWRRQSLPLAAVVIVFFYLVYLAAIPWSLLSGWSWILVLFLFKSFADLLLVRSVLRFMKIRTGLLTFLVGQILYPFYSIVISILANFGTYSWKGRKYRIS